MSIQCLQEVGNIFLVWGGFLVVRKKYNTPLEAYSLPVWFFKSFFYWGNSCISGWSEGTQLAGIIYSKIVCGHRWFRCMQLPLFAIAHLCGRGKLPTKDEVPPSPWLLTWHNTAMCLLSLFLKMTKKPEQVRAGSDFGILLFSVTLR